MMEWFAFQRQVAAGALRLAFWAESKVALLVKWLFIFAVAVVATATLQRKLSMSLDDSEPFFTLPVGVAITFGVFAVAIVACWAVSYTTIPRLVFAELDCETYDRHFAVRVKNRSKSKTIKKCRVVLAAIDPRPASVRPVPVAFHCSGQVIPTEFVDFRAEAENVFDVVHIQPNGQWLLLYYLPATRPSMPPGKYRITLRAEGEDIPSTTKDFWIEQTEKGINFCSCDGKLTARPAVAA
jgi:hypothetical protein